jgi:hypothetical protein
VQSHGLIVLLINSIGTSVILTEDLCDVLRHTIRPCDCTSCDVLEHHTDPQLRMTDVPIEFINTTIRINSIGTSVVLTEDLCVVLRHHN